MIAEPVSCAIRSRYINSGNRAVKCDGGTYPSIETRKDGKVNCMTTVTKDSMVPVSYTHLDVYKRQVGDINANFKYLDRESKDKSGEYTQDTQAKVWVISDADYSYGR